MEIQKSKPSSVMMKINQLQKNLMQIEENKSQEKVRSTYVPIKASEKMVNPFSVFKIFMVPISIHFLIPFLDWHD